MQIDCDKILKNLQTAEHLIAPEASKNIRAWLAGGFHPDWTLATLEELFEKGDFAGLEERFFKTLKFGTGGLRGRAVAANPAKAELGKPSPAGTPEHPALGTSNVNDFTIARAVMGLFEYAKKTGSKGPCKTPFIVIAHDVRHFSRRFCELSAAIWVKLGGRAAIFDSPKSTPELSYAVVKTGADFGAVITASHNPPCDNGFKVYLPDGGQLVPPHDRGIMECIDAIGWAKAREFSALSDISGVETLGGDFDALYIEAISESAIDPDFAKDAELTAVFSPIHGTGSVACPKLLRGFGINVRTVDAQMDFDPNFPSVIQPNPECPEALSLALRTAEEAGADCIVVTDPDADRISAAVKTRSGMQMLDANTTAALIADSRIAAMSESGLIIAPSRCALLKTFVTTPLLDSIARHYGLKCVNTLTGFKWIGAKLSKYENEARLNSGRNLDALPYAQKAAAMQKYSTFFVFGAEESYGYLGTDKVRDKDGNAAALMLCETVARLKKRGTDPDEYLDSLYLRCGFFKEGQRSIRAEGLDGTQKIGAFLDMLDGSRGLDFGDFEVAKFTNFYKDEIRDADGDILPKEKFFLYEFRDGSSLAIRASGTEPKIKCYAFAKESPKTPEGLLEAKAASEAKLKKLLDIFEGGFTAFNPRPEKPFRP